MPGSSSGAQNIQLVSISGRVDADIVQNRADKSGPGLDRIDRRHRVIVQAAAVKQNDKDGGEIDDKDGNGRFGSSGYEIASFANPTLAVAKSGWRTLG